MHHMQLSPAWNSGGGEASNVRVEKRNWSLWKQKGNLIFDLTFELMEVVHVILRLKWWWFFTPPVKISGSSGLSYNASEQNNLVAI